VQSRATLPELLHAKCALRAIRHVSGFAAASSLSTTRINASIRNVFMVSGGFGANGLLLS
jgi:hypothetical protein